MATGKIIKKLVESLRGAKARSVIYDTELKGFGIRMLALGIGTYFVEYRPGGGGRRVTKKRMVIGRVGELTPDQARGIAQDRLGDVRHGNDPLADRQTKRREMTVSGLIDQWHEENLPGRRTGKPMEPHTRSNTLARLFHHVVPILGKKRVSDVSVDDVNDFIRRVTKGETACDRPSAHKRGDRCLSTRSTTAKRRIWIARAEELLAEHDSLEGPDSNADLTRRKAELMEASFEARMCAQQCAVQLAPFVHPRLAAVAYDDRPREVINIVFGELDNKL
jgi:hypothetical protein